MSGISDIEKQQYIQVFSSLGPSPSGHISGAQAKNWLLNSNLPIQWLEKIWDLCDIDRDGQLDFDEFAVTYRLVNDLLGRVYTDVPLSLPPHLIPPSKIYLFTGGGGVGMYSQQGIGSMNSIPRAISPVPQMNISNVVPSYQLSQVSNPLPPSQNSFPTAPLSDDFDWYMPPADKFNYESEYTKRANSYGYVRFANFDELYHRLGIPREECMAAWNLVDVNFEQQIGKDQCLVFSHILNQRSKGKRIPNSLPSVLKTSLLRGKLNYNYNEAIDLSFKSKTSSDGGGSTRNSPSRSALKLEEQLQNELADLNEKIKKAEEDALSAYTSALQISSSGGSGVMSEFRQLYEHKQKELAELTEKEKMNRVLEEYIRKERSSTRELESNVQSLKSHIRTMENVLESTESEYLRLMQDIDSARLGR